MACCNSIFVFQGLILRLHDVPNSSHDVSNTVFLCVWAIVIKIVFFIQEMRRFCIFLILT